MYSTSEYNYHLSIQTNSKMLDEVSFIDLFDETHKFLSESINDKTITQRNVFEHLRKKMKLSDDQLDEIKPQIRIITIGIYGDLDNDFDRYRHKKKPMIQTLTLEQSDEDDSDGTHQHMLRDEKYFPLRINNITNFFDALTGFDIDIQEKE